MTQTLPTPQERLPIFQLTFSDRMSDHKRAALISCLFSSVEIVTPSMQLVTHNVPHCSCCGVILNRARWSSEAM
jgi:hypothetical protein